MLGSVQRGKSRRWKGGRKSSKGVSRGDRLPGREGKLVAHPHGRAREGGKNKGSKGKKWAERATIECTAGGVMSRVAGRDIPGKKKKTQVGKGKDAPKGEERETNTGEGDVAERKAEHIGVRRGQIKKEQMGCRGRFGIAPTQR